MAETLVFSDGFSSNQTLTFTDNAGTVLTPPASNPKGGYGMIELTNGKVAIIGGGSPNFTASGVGVYAADFLSSVSTAATAANVGIARDDSDQFYGIRTPTLYRYNASGTQLTSWTLTGSSILALAVNGAGTICYYVLAASQDTIRGWDLSGNTSLGVITTEAGYTIGTTRALYSNSTGDLFVGWNQGAGGDNGRIKRYNSTGTLQQTYALGSGTFPACITPAETDAEIWISYYDNAVATYSQVTVSKLTVSSGAVANTFNPVSGFIDFYTPFCAIDQGSPDVTVALSGVGGTGAAGTATPGISVTLSGVAATGSIGTLSVAERQISLSGVLGTGSAGSLSASATPERGGTLRMERVVDAEPLSE